MRLSILVYLGFLNFKHSNCNEIERLVFNYSMLTPCIPPSNLTATGASEIDRDDDSTYSLLNRRSSSGGLLSPEVDMAGHSSGGKAGEASETDGFYMLKKDSQRRTTLSKVLSHDEAKICAVWMEKIENNHNVQLVITKVNIVFVGITY